MNRTPIEWCRTYKPDGTFDEGYTVNPVRFRPYGSQRTTTMCQKISPGCIHCYAASIVRRFYPKDATEPFPGYTANGLAAGEFVLDEKQLQSVLKHKHPCRIFWGDMTDLFGAWVPGMFRDRCLAVCALTPHIEHIFLTKRPAIMANHFLGPAYIEHIFLTKRPAIMANHFLGPAYRVREALIGQHAQMMHLKRTQEPVLEWSGLPMPNIILGCSVEDQERADERMPSMGVLSGAGYRTMVSYEPALGPVNWAEWKFLDWLISGGESGSQARPSHPAWHRNARDFCAVNGIAYFFKQWGEWEKYDPIKHGSDEKRHFIDYRGRLVGPHESNPDGTDFRDWDRVYPAGKKAAGALLDGREHRAFPEVPCA